MTRRRLGSLFLAVLALGAPRTSAQWTAGDREDDASALAVFQRESPAESFANFLRLLRQPERRDQAKAYFAVELYLQHYNEHLAAHGGAAARLVTRREREQFLADVLESVTVLDEDPARPATAVGGFLSAAVADGGVRLHEVEQPRGPDGRPLSAREARLEVHSERRTVDADGRATVHPRADLVFLHLSSQAVSQGVWQWYWVERLPAPDEQAGPAPARLDPLEEVQQLRAALSGVARELQERRTALDALERRRAAAERRRGELLADLRAAETAVGPRGTPESSLRLLTGALRRDSFEEYQALHTPAARAELSEREAQRRFQDLVRLFRAPEALTAARGLEPSRGLAFEARLGAGGAPELAPARVRFDERDPDHALLEVPAIETLDGYHRAFTLTLSLRRVNREWLFEQPAGQ